MIPVFASPGDMKRRLLLGFGINKLGKALIMKGKILFKF